MRKLLGILAVCVMGYGLWVAPWQWPKQEPVKNVSELHVYIASGDKLIHLCATTDTVQAQRVTCNDGGVVLLTGKLYEQVVLSTKEIVK